MNGAAGQGEPTDEHIRRLELVTDLALSRLGVQDLLEELLERTRELLNVDTTAVLLLDPAGRFLIATAARGIEEEVHQGVRVPLGAGFAGRIAAERRPVIIEEVDHSKGLNPILRSKGVRSLLGVPLLTSDQVLGVLHVGSLTPRRFTEEDVDLLLLVADRVAFAVQSRTVEADRAAAVVLQRSLLPSLPPASEGVELASRYVAGGSGEVGGDWYDVFTLPDGRLWVVIGDVLGQGLHAAVTMGRLRSALRAYALDNEDPATVLAKLDREAQVFEAGIMATVLCGVLEPGRAEIRFSSAGHLTPLLAAPGRATEYLDVPPDLPIGIALDRPRRVTRVELPDRAVLCLFTDGLVERRGRSIDDGLAELRAAVRPEPAEHVCIKVMSTMVGAETPGDDIAVLALRRA